MRYSLFFAILFILSCSKESPIVESPSQQFGRFDTGLNATTQVPKVYASYSMQIDTVVDAHYNRPFRVIFPPFDPSKGTLDSVIVEGNSTIDVSYAYENATSDLFDFDMVFTRYGKIRVGAHFYSDTFSITRVMDAQPADTLDGYPNFSAGQFDGLFSTNFRMANKQTAMSYTVIHVDNQMVPSVSDPRVISYGHNITSWDRYKVTYVYIRK